MRLAIQVDRASARNPPGRMGYNALPIPMSSRPAFVCGRVQLAHDAVSSIRSALKKLRLSAGLNCALAGFDQDNAADPVRQTDRLRQPRSRPPPRSRPQPASCRHRPEFRRCGSWDRRQQFSQNGCRVLTPMIADVTKSGAIAATAPDAATISSLPGAPACAGSREQTARYSVGACCPVSPSPAAHSATSMGA